MLIGCSGGGVRAWHADTRRSHAACGGGAGLPSRYGARNCTCSLLHIAPAQTCMSLWQPWGLSPDKIHTAPGCSMPHHHMPEGQAQTHPIESWSPVGPLLTAHTQLGWQHGCSWVVRHAGDAWPAISIKPSLMLPACCCVLQWWPWLAAHQSQLLWWLPTINRGLPAATANSNGKEQINSYVVASRATTSRPFKRSAVLFLPGDVGLSSMAYSSSGSQLVVGTVTGARLRGRASQPQQPGACMACDSADSSDCVWKHLQAAVHVLLEPDMHQCWLMVGGQGSVNALPGTSCNRQQQQQQQQAAAAAAAMASILTLCQGVIQ